MIPYLRKEKILAILHEKEILTIDELKQHIEGISNSTLRRDLKFLEEDGKIMLLGGGAVKLCSISSELPVSTKMTIHKKSKDSIAKLAANLISDGDIIYLDSGTTCSALMDLISKKKITIITSNTAILQSPETFECQIIFLGGELNNSLSSVNGSLTYENIVIFNFDKAFIGANGVDVLRGVTTPTLIEATKKKKAAAQAKEVYVLCDSSKFGKHSMTKAFDIDQCTIISDRDDEILRKVTTIISPKSTIE